MTPEEEIARAITEAIEAVQRASGHPVVPVRPETKPIGDLPGFDSLLGIETTLELEDRLGRLPFQNIFVNDAGTRALRLEEVVARIAAAGVPLP